MGNGGNNILDKSAMETLRSLEVQVPQLQQRLGSVETGLADVKGDTGPIATDVNAIKVSMAEIATQLKVVCPARAKEIDEIKSGQKDQDKRLDGHGERLATIESNLKWYAAGVTALSAAITTAANAIVAAVKGP